MYKNVQKHLVPSTYILSLFCCTLKMEYLKFQINFT